MELREQSEANQDPSIQKQESFAISDSPLQDPQKSIGKWSEQENAKYVAFLELYRAQSKTKEGCRTTKFYKQMASFIETRNSLQCRTHHQKLEAKHRYPNRIISDYKKYADLATYFRIKEQFKRNEPPCPGFGGFSSPPKVQQTDGAIQTEIEGMGVRFITEEQWAEQEQAREWGERGSQGVNSSSMNVCKTEESLGSNPYLIYPYYYQRIE